MHALHGPYRAKAPTPALCLICWGTTNVVGFFLRGEKDRAAPKILWQRDLFWLFHHRLLNTTPGEGVKCSTVKCSTSCEFFSVHGLCGRPWKVIARPRDERAINSKTWLLKKYTGRQFTPPEIGIDPHFFLFNAGMHLFVSIAN